MLNLLMVGLGGFLGSVSRYGLSSWLTRSLGEPAFPVGILLVNLAGCLAIGVAFGLAEARDLFASQHLRLLVFAGFLGGFTTFSTFGIDTFLLLRGGQLGYAAANILISVIGGVLAVWAGYRGAMRWAE